MDFAGALEVFDRYGIAFGILVVIGVATWRIGRWCAPRIDEAMRRHFSFMDRLDANQIKHGEVLDRIAMRQEAQDENVLKIGKSLARVYDNLERIESRLPSKE